MQEEPQSSVSLPNSNLTCERSKNSNAIHLSLVNLQLEVQHLKSENTTLKKMVKEKDELLTNVLDLSNKKSHENTQCECAFQALVTGNLSNMRDHILREFHSKGLDGKMIATAIITSIKQKKRLCMYLVRETLCHLWEEIHEEIKPNIICEVQERFSPWTCSFLAYDLIIRQAEFDGQPYA